MRKIVLSMCAFLFIAQLGFSRGQESVSRKEVKDTTMRDTAKTDRSEYISRVESRISEWDNQITKLKISRDALSPTADRYQKLSGVIQDMEIKLSEARGNLDELKAIAASDWTQFKTRIEASLSDVKKAHDKALAE